MKNNGQKIFLICLKIHKCHKWVKTEIMSNTLPTHRPTPNKIDLLMSFLLLGDELLASLATLQISRLSVEMGAVKERGLRLQFSFLVHPMGRC